MIAPTDIYRGTAGHAVLEVTQVAGESAVTSAFATSPLKLLTPRTRGRSVWAFASSFGGGLVAGDQTRLDLRLGASARCFVGTQASTKIYRNPSCRPCGHVTQATLEAGSFLVFAPDPAQPFAHSTYSQRQEFHLGPDAGLVLVDWFCSGRVARGERWAFQRFQSRNEVWSIQKRTSQGVPELVPHLDPPPLREEIVSSALAETAPIAPLPAGEGSGEGEATDFDAVQRIEKRAAQTIRRGRPLFLDSLLLDSAEGSLESRHRTGRFNCFALLLVLGAPVRRIAAQILESVSGQPVPRGGTVVFSASPAQDGGVFRVAGNRVEEVARELHRHLLPVAELLGDDPFARKW